MEVAGIYKSLHSPECILACPMSTLLSLFVLYSDTCLIRLIGLLKNKLLSVGELLSQHQGIECSLSSISFSKFPYRIS